MPSVTYRYISPFVVDGQGRVPITLHTRKWQQLHENAYRLWLRVEVTDFGTQLVTDGAPESAKVPSWYDQAAAEQIAWWIERINSGNVPADEIESVVGTRGIPTVESMSGEPNGLHLTMRLLAPEMPVRAAIGPFLATFDPESET